MCWTAGNATRTTCAAERIRRSLSARSCAPTSGLALASLILRYQPDHSRPDHRRLGALRPHPSEVCPPRVPRERPYAAVFPADELFSQIPFVSSPDDSLPYACALPSAPPYKSAQEGLRQPTERVGINGDY